MCRLSNLYVLDLYDNTATGGIEFNVANSIPSLMNAPCKIVVKQIQSDLRNGTPDISNTTHLRVIHNINIQSGTNWPGFSNSNVLAFIDNFQVRTVDATHMTGFSSTECILYAPNGLPAILTLNRAGTGTPMIADNAALSWSVRLEITVRPEEE